VGRIAAAARAALVGALTGCATIHQPPLPFLERTYAAKVPKDTSLMYEGQVATHVLVVDGLADAYDAISQQPATGSAGAWRVIITPMFRVRQLHDSSAAVRTPSFMPRASVEYLRATRLGKVTTRPVVSFDWVNVSGLRVTLAHHSNGQAGCFREGFVPRDVRSNECIPAPGADTTVVKLNRANGDFSSTFFNFMVHSTWMNRSGNDEATHSLGAAAGYDWHVHGIFGELSPEQRSLYGSWRLHGFTEAMQRFGVGCRDPGAREWYATGACWLAGRSRVTLEGERAPRFPGDLARRIRPAVLPYRWSVEVSHSADRLLGAGAFVRWHDGQDYYNIGFVNRRKVFMWGLMLDLSGFDRIGAKVVQ
jgi:hypothetical protein